MSVRGAAVLVGADLAVPLATGGTSRYVDLDYAASTRPLRVVADAVAEFTPWYSSVHRGAGYRSQISTAVYERARDSVARFVSARPTDEVIFTRNTTDSVNLLARTLPKGTRVLSTAIEHHADMLPWRLHEVDYTPVPTSAEQLLDLLEQRLRRGGVGLVAMSGATNVTGELLPVRAAAALAHRYGARIFVDAAQLAPHAPIDMTGDALDYVAFSGHKVYAPYGAGVLVGRRDWLDAAEPYLRGGGAVELVTLDDVIWSVGADRHESGSPNVIGAAALGLAVDWLAREGMADIAKAEAELCGYARAELSKVPNIHLFTTWAPESPRIGILTFDLPGYRHGLLATILSAEHGIAVRHGCFCAHPLVAHLLAVGDERMRDLGKRIRAKLPVEMPGAVRASMGIDTTRRDIDALGEALDAIARKGPRLKYATANGHADYAPDPDPRPRPSLAFLERTSAT